MKYEKLAKIAFPRKYLNWLEKNLTYSNIQIKKEKFCTTILLYSISITILLFSLFLIFNLKQLIILIPIFSIITFLIPHLILIILADKNAEFVENILPDMLQLIAANIRSGLTPDKALLISARPEFGILEKEIRIAGSKAVSGQPIEESLLEISKKIKSRLVERTFKLIVEGMRKGGELAKILEEVADDVREIKLLKKEIAAQVSMYSLFIIIAVGVAAPILFSISTFLIKTMAEISQTLNIENVERYSNIGIGIIKFGSIKISPTFITYYSFSVLFITSIFSSMIIGILKEGKEKAGIKYIPIFLTLQTIIFLLSQLLLSYIFGSITVSVSI